MQALDGVAAAGVVNGDVAIYINVYVVVWPRHRVRVPVQCGVPIEVAAAAVPGNNGQQRAVFEQLD